jgi:hypothetical protein
VSALVAPASGKKEAASMGDGEIEAQE